jgi:MOSC domain-containing protein YiiM
MRPIQLLSIQAGLPQTYTSQRPSDPNPSLWTSAFFKEPVSGAVWLNKTHLAGDRQASSKTHGGPEKAICVYPWEHYSYWKNEFALPELIYGAFGENFTLQGQLEDQACIGDSVALGEVVLQISQPRPPCWRLARWWQREEFATRMEETGRTGWYCRVIKEGYVEAGTAIELLERPFPEWSISVANDLIYGDGDSLDKMSALASCHLLSESWREAVLKRLAKFSTL